MNVRCVVSSCNWVLILYVCVCVCGKVAQVINRAATGKVSPVAMVSFHRKVLDAQNVDQRGKTK